MHATSPNVAPKDDPSGVCGSAPHTLKLRAVGWGFGIGSGIPAVLATLGLFHHALPAPFNSSLSPLAGHAGLGPLILIFVGVPAGGAIGTLIGSFAGFLLAGREFDNRSLMPDADFHRRFYIDTAVTQNTF